MAQSDLAGPIGRPLDRVDGPLKVTGKAKYAFEYAVQGHKAILTGPAHFGDPPHFAMIYDVTMKK